MIGKDCWAWDSAKKELQNTSDFGSSARNETQNLLEFIEAAPTIGLQSAELSISEHNPWLKELRPQMSAFHYSDHLWPGLGPRSDGKVTSMAERNNNGQINASKSQNHAEPQWNYNWDPMDLVTLVSVLFVFVVGAFLDISIRTPCRSICSILSSSPSGHAKLPSHSAPAVLVQFRPRSFRRTKHAGDLHQFSLFPVKISCRSCHIFLSISGYIPWKISW